MVERMRRIKALSRLIVLDGLRRYSVIGLALFALAGIAGGLVFFDFIPRDIGRATNDLLFSIIWLAGLIFLLFHAVQVASWDSNNGALHTYLARPVTRTEYLLSLYSGLAFLLVLLNVILGGGGWLLLLFIKSSVAEVYFPHLSLPFYLLTCFGLYFIQLVMLAAILVISSAIRGSFPVLLLTLCYYFISTGLPVVRESIKARSGNPDSYLNVLLKWLTAVFPDFSHLDFKSSVTSPGFIYSTTDVTLTFFMFALYVIISLWLACAVLERRDLQ